ncbi:MAG: SEC-C domain-containing protein [Caldilineaceae bacterium]|nr:SEC-C domain-containing protein [Caldilineaceae bacterium]
MKNDARSESEIFSELAILCASPGYAHAIAYFCFRDNTIGYSDVMTPEDVLQQFSMERLVRTEISTLIGLACKRDLDTNLPPPDIVNQYIEKTESLLQEIHQSMMPSLEEMMNFGQIGTSDFNPFSDGSFLREAIFYGGESAYHFQYKGFSELKYRKDNDWLINNKGYSVEQAIGVVTSITTVQNKAINEILASLAEVHPAKWSMLDAYTFTCEEVCAVSGIDLDIVNNMVRSFISPVGLEEFRSLDDFNPKNAYPIISLPNGRYLLFQAYSLVEALYETPFFWFNADKRYQSIAMQHRGEFTEEFSADRLRLVFGKHRVFQNIDIVDSKRNKAGEIDVLVVFADRAIVLQAKSKKLTIAARKGNDLSLRDDFKKAVQEAYDQAFLCSSLLTNGDYKLMDKAGNELQINRDYKEIYPFCVVSDHYPALSFQARQFLEFQQTEKIRPPFVMDVFFLDVITEMLQSPLHLLSYINRRTLYGDKLISTHELTILAYHLKRNLWMGGENEILQFGDDICADLDLAMLTRRNDVPGIDIPKGILTDYKGSHFDQIIRDIEALDHPATIDLGFMLLTLSGDTIEMINDGITQLRNLGRIDGKPHDLTLVISEGSTGLTIHCNDDPEYIAAPRLDRHCELRKYRQKAEQWFGVCLSSRQTNLRFGVNKIFKWVHSTEMDELVKDLPNPQNLTGKKHVDFQAAFQKTKMVGRNEKCPCGSGRKFKNCCLNKM